MTDAEKKPEETATMENHNEWRTQEPKQLHVNSEGLFHSGVDDGSKYLKVVKDREGNTARVDVYDILRAFEITNPALQHALKKFLLPGGRGSKGAEQDLEEGIVSVRRAITIFAQERQERAAVEAAVNRYTHQLMDSLKRVGNQKGCAVCPPRKFDKVKLESVTVGNASEVSLEYSVSGEDEKEESSHVSRVPDSELPEAPQFAWELRRPVLREIHEAKSKSHAAQAIMDSYGEKLANKDIIKILGECDITVTSAQMASYRQAWKKKQKGKKATTQKKKVQKKKVQKKKPL